MAYGARVYSTVRLTENELMEVLRSREMRVLATRIVWVHVLVPGQESHSFDLPTEYVRSEPTIRIIGHPPPRLLLDGRSRTPALEC